MRKLYTLLFLFLNKMETDDTQHFLNTLIKRIRVSLLIKRGFDIDNSSNIQSHIKIVGNVKLGKNSGIGQRSEILASLDSSIQIGENVMMGPECIIYTQNHQYQDLSIPMCYQGFYKKNVKIGDDVWIGRRVIILPGAIINSGTVIAAGAVVSGKEYPANSIIGGIPAKVIKYR